MISPLTVLFNSLPANAIRQLRGEDRDEGEGVVSSWFHERLFQIQKSGPLPKIIGKKAYKSVRSSHSDTWQDC